MGSIYCLMGKSSTGKDTVYKRILEAVPDIKRLVPGTTRPIREGETDGVEYYFYTNEQLEQLMSQGKVIENRAYDTVHGIWNYFTVDREDMDLSKHDYLNIGTLESYVKLRDYYGGKKVVPLYLYVADDGVRLQRALLREMEQKEPKYKEMCRRFLADEEDFSVEKLEEAGITESMGFVNEDLDRTVEEMRRFIEAGGK